MGQVWRSGAGGSNDDGRSRYGREAGLGERRQISEPIKIRGMEDEGHGQVYLEKAKEKRGSGTKSARDKSKVKNGVDSQ